MEASPGEEEKAENTKTKNLYSDKSKLSLVCILIFKRYEFMTDI